MSKKTKVDRNTIKDATAKCYDSFNTNFDTFVTSTMLLQTTSTHYKLYVATFHILIPKNASIRSYYSALNYKYKVETQCSFECVNWYHRLMDVLTLSKGQ